MVFFMETCGCILAAWIWGSRKQRRAIVSIRHAWLSPVALRFFIVYSVARGCVIAKVCSKNWIFARIAFGNPVYIVSENAPAYLL